MEIRNRIKRLDNVPLGTLLNNDKNWRKHPENQKSAIRGVLQKIGMADAFIAYERKGSKGKKELVLVDGHLRKSQMDQDAIVPVLVLDVTEEEASAILASHDSIGAMAVTDEEALRSLVGEISSSSLGLDSVMESIGISVGSFGSGSVSGIDESSIHDVVKVEYKYLEPYKKLRVLISASSEDVDKVQALVNYAESVGCFDVLNGGG